MAGWEEICCESKPYLEKIIDESPGGRFDLCALLHLLEHSLPMVLLTYPTLVRANRRAVPPSETDEPKLYRQARAFLCVEAAVRHHKNYAGAWLHELDLELYWKRTNHSMFAHLEDMQSAADEAFVGRGLNTRWRRLQKSNGEEATRLAAKRASGVISRIYLIAGIARADFGAGRKSKVAKLTEPKNQILVRPGC
jgi:hypothetical protein